jgi:hypothetical protein
MSDILVKGMEMPTRCGECLLAKLSPTGESLICNYMLSRVSWEERPFDCPLVPVPPHGRLGDLDAFESVKYELPNGQKAFNRGFHSGVQFMQRLIMDAPTIIPAEEGE